MLGRGCARAPEIELGIGAAVVMTAGGRTAVGGPEQQLAS